MKQGYLGVDIGGTNIVCGLLNEEFELLSSVKRPTEAEFGPESVYMKIEGMLGELMLRTGWLRSQVGGVGIGCPGLIDSENGACRFSGNLKWRDEPVAAKLQERMGYPVFVENDVRMFAVGEAEKGAGQGADYVLALTLGTGMNSAFVARGSVLRGGGGLAGEIGHVPVAGEATPCGCGLTGCLETVASATGIARQARERIAAEGDGHLGRLARRDGTVTAAAVAEAAGLGDADAQAVLAHTGRTLGKALASAVTLLSPDVVVIGGGAARAGEALFAPLREELAEHLLPMLRQRVQVRSSALGDAAALIGCGVYAARRLRGGC